METNRYHDLMKEALARRQSAGLSPDFTARTLLRLQREKARKEHRTEIWGLITISVISLALVASVGIILYFYDILPSKENVNDILLTIKRNFKLYLVESLPYYGLALLAGILLFADYLWRKHWYNSRRSASATYSSHIHTSGPRRPTITDLCGRRTN